MKKACREAHWEPTRSDAAEAYCQKEDSRLDGPWHFGEKPVQRNSKASWEEIRDKAKSGKLEEIPADVYVRCYSTLKRIAEDNQPIGETLPECRGIIIQGEAGIGKTSYVRSIVPTESLYLKGRNKWWDGYQD